MSVVAKNNFRAAVVKDTIDRELEIKIRNAVGKMLENIKESTKLDIAIEVISIEPMGASGVNSILNNVLSIKNTLGRKHFPLGKDKIKDNIRKMAVISDYMVKLKWTVQPMKKRISGTKVDRIIYTESKNATAYESCAIFDVQKCMLKYDTIGALIPGKIEVCKNPLSRSSGTVALNEYIFSFSDNFGNVKKYHCNIKATYNNFSEYASQTTPNDVKVNVNLDMWCERNAWYAICSDLICLLGEGGSFPSFCPGDGTAFDSTVQLEVPTDYFESGTLKVDDDNGWSFNIGFSFSFYAGVSIVPSYDTSKFATVAFPDSRGDRILIKHIPKCGVTPPVRGLYYKKGSLEFNGKIIANGSPEIGTGYIAIRIPVYFGYAENYLIASSLTLNHAGVINIYMRYIRGNAISRPGIVITTNAFSIDIGGTTYVNVAITNNSANIGLENIQVILDSNTLANVLSLNSGGWTRNIQAIPANTTANVTYELRGNHTGSCVPRFDVHYHYADPAPDEMQDPVSVDGQTITVDESSYYIGNSNTKELHIPQCEWASKIAPGHKKQFSSINQALSQGYNGCYYCLRQYDTD